VNIRWFNEEFVHENWYVNSKSLMSKRINFKILNLKKPVNCAFGNLLLAILQHTEAKLFLAKALRKKNILT
jgi:hypothetical protein